MVSPHRKNIVVAWLRAAAFFACAGVAVASLADAAGVPIVVERYEAAIGDAQLPQLLRGEFDDHLVAESPEKITPSHHGTTWYRLRLVRDWISPHAPVLAISDANDMIVRAYVPPDYAGAEYSIYHADNARGFARRILVVSLPSAWRSGTPVYLRIDSATAVEHEFVVTDTAAAQDEELAQMRRDTVWPVVQIALLLAALMFFNPLRDRTGALFLAQTFCIALATSYKSGLGFEYWPFNLLAPLGIRANALAADCVMMLALAFARRFLDLARHAPLLGRASFALTAVLAAFAAACILPVPLPNWLLMSLLAPVMWASMALLVACGIVCWRCGQRGAAMFVLAWTPITLVFSVRAAGLILQTASPTVLGGLQSLAFLVVSLGLLRALALRMVGGPLARHSRAGVHDRDALTGAFNRSATFAHLRSEFVDARSKRRPLSVLSIEIDRELRERVGKHGRGAIDECMCAAMGPLIEELRGNDAIGRYGDDHFLVTLRGVDVDDARMIAQRIARRVGEVSVHVAGEAVRLKIHVGVAALGGDMMTPDALVSRAAADGAAAAAGRSAPPERAADASI